MPLRHSGATLSATSMTDLVSSSGSAGTDQDPPTPLPRFDIAVLRVDPDGRVRFSNGVLERELAREPRALVGRPLHELADDRSRERIANALEAADGTELSLANGVFQIARDEHGVWLVRLPIDSDSTRLRADIDERNEDLARTNGSLAKAIEQLKEQKEELEQQKEELELQTEQLSEQADVVTKRLVRIVAHADSRLLRGPRQHHRDY